MLEVQQRDHQAQSQARATGVTQAGASELRSRPEEVGTLGQTTIAILVR